MIRMVTVFNRFPEMTARGIAGGTAAKQTGIQTFAARARATVHVESGELRASIAETGDGVTAGTDHAYFNEYGTSKMAARPFMHPAVPGAVQAMRGVLRAALG